MRTNYDYSQTMMMKILCSVKGSKSGSTIVHSTFEDCLDIIRQVDNITMSCPKIVYLVGWQYDGHDDKYPAFFAVNQSLKREQDESGIDSLIWLIAEAKKYNTVVSLHINLTDAYEDSPLWDSYIKKNLILLRRNGKPKPTGVWHGHTAYQVRYEQELSSGMYYRRIDKLLKMFPQGTFDTIHVDAFFVRKGKNTKIRTEKSARQDMIKYFNFKGIDITSEFIYREKKGGFKAHFGISDTIGLIPAFWNPVYSKKDIIKYPAKVLAGNYHCKALTLDKTIGWLIYGNIWGENIFGKEDWQQKFLTQYACYNLPYHYLNSFERIRIRGIGRFRELIHSDGVVSKIVKHAITKDGVYIKKGEELLIPIPHLDKTFALYSKAGGELRYQLDGEIATVSEVTARGLDEVTEYIHNDNILRMTTKEKSLYKIELR